MRGGFAAIFINKLPHQHPGEGNSNSLQHSCLGNPPMDRGAWQGYSPWGCKESDTTEQLNSHESECNYDYPGGSAVKNLPANAGGAASIPGSGRSPGGGNGNPLQYFCLGNPMDRGAWWATVHGVTKESDTNSNKYYTNIGLGNIQQWKTTWGSFIHSSTSSLTDLINSSQVPTVLKP